jgi:hypothetical protein
MPQRPGKACRPITRVERDDGQVAVLAKKRLTVNREKRVKVAA